jgi:hypothetical protein
LDDYVTLCDVHAHAINPDKLRAKIGTGAGRFVAPVRRLAIDKATYVATPTLMPSMWHTEEQGHETWAAWSMELEAHLAIAGVAYRTSDPPETQGAADRRAQFEAVQRWFDDSCASNANCARPLSKASACFFRSSMTTAGEVHALSVTIRELPRTTLRHRPDRILVGEVRGGEAFDSLQVLNTSPTRSIWRFASPATDAFVRIERYDLTDDRYVTETLVDQSVPSADRPSQGDPEGPWVAPDHRWVIVGLALDAVKTRRVASAWRRPRGG